MDTVERQFAEHAGRPAKRIEVTQVPRCGTAAAWAHRQPEPAFRIEPLHLILAAFAAMLLGFLCGRRSRPRRSNVSWKEGAEV